jgi:hypothetical protein
MTLQQGGVYVAMIAVTYLWVRFNRANLDDAFSPFSLLLPFWILPYLGSLLKLSEFQRGLSFEGHVLVVCATMGMVLPSLAAAYLLRRAPLSSPLERFTASSLQYTVGCSLVIAFLLVTVTAEWLAVFAGRPIPLAEYAAGGASSAELHQAGMTSRLQIIGHAMHLAGAIALYIGLTGRGLRRFTFLGLAVVPPALGILRAFKSDVFLSLLYYAAVIYYYRRSRNFGFPRVKTAVLAIGIGAGLALITTLRSTGVENPALYSQLIAFKYVHWPFPANEVFGVVYGYMSLPFENFARYVEYGHHDMRLGISMFRPLFSVFMQGQIPDNMLAGINWYFVAPFANAPNGLTDLYGEGGPLLCIVGPLAYGVLVNSIYLRFRRSGSITWLFVYINFLLPWVWMFFHNAFSVLNYYAHPFYVATIVVTAESLQRWMRSAGGTSVAEAVVRH